MPNLTVEPDAVIRRLADQIASLSVELAVRDAALTAAQERIAELEPSKE